MVTHRHKIAFWHRYGPADHAAAGGHCIPYVIEHLAKDCEVHYFGLRTRTPIPAAILENAVVHSVPYTLDRSCLSNKIIGTAIWYLALPFIALRCRLMRVTAVFMDETLPLAPLIAFIFFGRQVAITVADFFLNIYFARNWLLRPLICAVQQLDYACWRRLPLIFTKVKYTQTFLAGIGVDPCRVKPVYNPCDRNIYFPTDKAEAKRRLGLPQNALVLVHHGVLHPNKGNDRIIRALSEIGHELGDWRFLLVGSGPELNDLKELANDLGVNNRVVFTGWLRHEMEVNWALNAADIGLVMRIGQYSDNFHMTDTLVHEMACGLPILTARLRGIAEVVLEGGAGLLFDPNDMSEFKTKMRRLANDAVLRQQLGQRAYAIACVQFDVHNAARAISEPLLKLAGIR